MNPLAGRPVSEIVTLPGSAVPVPGANVGVGQGGSEASTGESATPVSLPVLVSGVVPESAAPSWLPPVSGNALLSPVPLSCVPPLDPPLLPPQPAAVPPHASAAASDSVARTVKPFLPLPPSLRVISRTPFLV